MREAERIADQFRRAHEGEAWHGPSLKELLQDVNAGEASARPVAGAHSILELVLHIAAWERVARRRLEGEAAQIYNTPEDWPAGEVSEDAWRAALRTLEEEQAKLRATILRLDDANLDGPIFKEMSSIYVTLHGVVQHSLYHAGQIAVLKKALRPTKTNT
ncbi:MAG TPA: DinB family protein [Pyrinomonadaceae bacterium]|nr:DinB family protein [Pyrinomonadaceae bacterium]